jgi:hypothetical protein
MVEMAILIPYGHSSHISLRYIHTGIIGELNKHQCHQSLQYFTRVLDDHDRTIIFNHL